MKYTDKLINEALSIEAETAIEAGTLGFMTRAMTQATMPHSETGEQSHVRVNGNFRLIMTAGDPSIGLPYGTIPRLILAWITSEAVKTQERELSLGSSMSEFMRKLGMLSSGGQSGSITRLKDQSKRLLGCMVTCSYTNQEHYKDKQFLLADEKDFWWTPTDVETDPDQQEHFRTNVTLSQSFYEEIINHPVPIDMRILKSLRRSPMALDIYCWLTYRIYTHNLSRRNKVTIPWQALQGQFGSGYPYTSQGKRDFKKQFIKRLHVVHSLFYSQARIEVIDEGLILKKSPQHIPNAHIPPAAIAS